MEGKDRKIWELAQEAVSLSCIWIYL